MKFSPSALDVLAALLAVGAVTAFVPTSSSRTPELDHRLMFSTHTFLSPTTASTTTCFASSVDVDEIASSASSSSSPSSTPFPFNDRQVRFAYDEWRLIYGKGDYDATRFGQFKTNHRTLIISNMNTRENAAQQGLPMPQWMSLNEYGDYSVDEFEAMLNGNDNMVYSSGNYDEQQQDRGTQVVQQGQGQEQGRSTGTQVVRDAYSMNYNNGQVQEYQDQFGRTIRSTQVLQQDSMAQQQAASYNNVDSNYANNIGDDELYYPQEGGTQVVSTNNGGASGTQVVNRNNGAPNTSYGTQVVRSGNDRSSNAPISYGTQVVKYADPNANASRGTHVVRSGNDQSSNAPTQPTSYGTQVIQYSDPTNGVVGGTQVVQSSSGPGTSVVQPTTTSSTSDGTQIIPKSEEGDVSRGSTDPRGTVVISKDDKESWSKILGNMFGSEDDDSNNNADDDDDDNNDGVVGSRGTMVIKRSFQVAEEPPKTSKNPFSVFGSRSSSTDEEKEDEQQQEVMEEEPAQEAKSLSFFDFMSSPKEDLTTASEKKQKEEEIEQKSKSGGGGGGGIFSFFGGNVKSANSRAVRTTITLQEQPTTGTTKVKKAPVVSKRKTLLIPDKQQNENGMPSILSFFGGAKKVTEEETARNPNARPTLIVKKPQKYLSSQIWSPFSAKKKTQEDTTDQKDTTSPNIKNDVIAAQIANARDGVERAAKRKAEIDEEREIKRLEREQKRVEATQRREAEARQRAGKPALTTTTFSKPTTTTTRGTRSVATTPEPPKTISPFAFFGAVGRQATPPTMKNWKQNRDGTITGLIYDSKSFKDGTRITTSPVPRGARKATVVKTAGGSKYSLT